MAGSSWSSSSRTSSFGSLDDDVVCVVKPPDAVAAEGSSVKFLCSYGGRILPRHTDGALRYVGGDNRVLSVDRSLLHFYELQRKLKEMCGCGEVTLRCQLPTEDLDALVAVTSDDDLANLLEEYDAAGKDRRLQPLKIRAFLFLRMTPAAPPSLPPRSSSPPTPTVRTVQQAVTKRHPSPPSEQYFPRRPRSRRLAVVVLAAVVGGAPAGLPPGARGRRVPAAAGAAAPVPRPQRQPLAVTNEPCMS